jgi:hypothetical protein
MCPVWMSLNPIFLVVNNYQIDLENESMHKLNAKEDVMNKIKMELVAEALTGASENALNISNKAPNISIRKLISQALFKAYALTTNQSKFRA